MAISDRAFAARNVAVLREAHGALNVAFGAILSAYVGVSMAEIDNHPFDQQLLARFFLSLAIFILCLSVGNGVILRAEYRLGVILLAVGGIVAIVAHHQAVMLGFRGAILRIISGCWVVGLLGSNAVLTAINYLHHRSRT